MRKNLSFDYIIVGSGPAGCVLANRLSENKSLSILLIEAGGSDKRLIIRMPAAFAMAAKGETVMLVHCTNSLRYGLVTVMTASNGYISGNDPGEILRNLRDSLGY